MNLLTLQPIPNQSFSTLLENVRYDISVHETNGVMAASIIRNEVLIVDSIRITAGTLLLPYRYQENGNFIFLNLNDDLIYYPNFGASQNMFYLSVADLANLRSGQNDRP
jgi:hypothetical protein